MSKKRRKQHGLGSNVQATLDRIAVQARRELEPRAADAVLDELHRRRTRRGVAALLARDPQPARQRARLERGARLGLPEPRQRKLRLTPEVQRPATAGVLAASAATGRQLGGRRMRQLMNERLPQALRDAICQEKHRKAQRQRQRREAIIAQAASGKGPSLRKAAQSPREPRQRSIWDDVQC